MAKLLPVGAVQRAGASASRRRCRSQGIRVRSAPSRASGLSAASERTPASSGASQSSRRAARAASERSGQAGSRGAQEGRRGSRRPSRPRPRAGRRRPRRGPGRPGPRRSGRGRGCRRPLLDDQAAEPGERAWRAAAPPRSPPAGPRSSSWSAKAVEQLGLVQRRGQQDAVARARRRPARPPPARARGPGRRWARGRRRGR